MPEVRRHRVPRRVDPDADPDTDGLLAVVVAAAAFRAAWGCFNVKEGGQLVGVKEARVEQPPPLLLLPGALLLGGTGAGGGGGGAGGGRWPDVRGVEEQRGLVAVGVQREYVAVPCKGAKVSPCS